MTNPDQPSVTIYTDGGAEPNPGDGGYGILLIFPDHQRELSGGDPDTTNNRMELTAACIALESLSEPHNVTLYTDSEYVKKGITEWIAGWVRKGWKDVKNPDLWQRLYQATLRHKIQWKWVRGHAGNMYNERVDQLATAARLRVKQTKRVITAEPVEQTLHAEANPTAGTSASPTPTLGAAKFDFVIHTAVDLDPKTKGGGWAVIIDSNGATQDLSGAERSTSEYHLALLAAVNALSALQGSGSVQMHTDNETVQKGASQWIKGWRKNGWKNAQGKPIAHQDLWQRLDEILQKRTVIWKVADHPNPKASGLAKTARLTLKSN